MSKADAVPENQAVTKLWPLQRRHNGQAIASAPGCPLAGTFITGTLRGGHGSRPSPLRVQCSVMSSNDRGTASPFCMSIPFIKKKKEEVGVEEEGGGRGGKGKEGVG
ncbi:hypothetical protein PoB_003739800 [Plakobranchus ocellatus]|uniref:Uncharacterized protein n=1 Tax=Plakobranchus ocellatus TaxID=259542 RepID=A0AAV4AVM9_9GAST|nr:hypothetical protein PoB_003739800 [Plakobranchus ocellatus]